MSFRFVAALILCAGTCFLTKIKAKGYLKVDFHQRTTHTQFHYFDTIVGSNSTAKAFSDLRFYSNPMYAG